MMLAQKIALVPNNRQATYFAKAAGTARFAYNWALAEWNRQYEAHKTDPSLPKPSEMALRRQLNTVKREQFPWMLEVTKSAPEQAIRQLGAAFANFFAGRARHPTFRRKGVHERFTIGNSEIRVEGSRVRIPRLGWVRMREPLRFEGKVMSATVSRVADRWFVSIAVELPDLSHLPAAESQGAIGVDLGIGKLATLSNGETIEGPKAYGAALDRLRRLSRDLARKQKGSRNRHKARMKLARCHAQIANIRRDALHKLTTDLTRRFDTIGIEDLDVSAMLKDRYRARYVADMGFGEFRRQLEYKAELRGGQVFVAERDFPSSRTCSVCGHVLEALGPRRRKWTCPECGTNHDRDLNAAINLRNMAVGSTVSVCGEDGSGRSGNAPAKPASGKQEVSIEPPRGAGLV